jgi:hypothetical protein
MAVGNNPNCFKKRVNTMIFDLQMISTLIAFLTALTAIYAILAENRNSRFTTGVDLALRLEDKFWSKNIKESRSSLADAILGNKEITEEGFQVIYMFETLGLLLRRGAIDPDMAHSCFFPWISVYWYCLCDRIEIWREETLNLENLYTDFEKMSKRLISVEAKKVRKPEKEIIDMVIANKKSFLDSGRF